MDRGTAALIKMGLREPETGTTEERVNAKIQGLSVALKDLAAKNRTPEFAWVHLVRLSGCNYKQPITRKGRSVYINDPQGQGRYRIDAAKFDAGESQYRESWGIARWDEKAERITNSEKGWLD